MINRISTNNIAFTGTREAIIPGKTITKIPGICIPEIPDRIPLGVTNEKIDQKTLESLINVREQIQNATPFKKVLPYKKQAEVTLTDGRQINVTTRNYNVNRMPKAFNTIEIIENSPDEENPFKKISHTIEREELKDKELFDTVFSNLTGQANINI